jgi:membrane-bound lytic murein transglycosylase D
MKRLIAFLFPLITFSGFGQSRPNLPKAPSRVEFANVIVSLDDYTRNKVDNLILNLLTPENSYLEAKLERMHLYFPIIEPILKQEGVPDDLKYLAVQESNLMPDALSSSGAVGFWQFKDYTAAELGLKMNHEIDERKYIFESTRAAAKYFKKNNIIFKNWLSCIYAYNQGPTGASKEIPDYWSYASEVKFDNNTPNYLIKALAHRIAFEYRLNRFQNTSEKKLLIYPTHSKSLAEIALELDVDLNELKSYNAWLYAPVIPAGSNYNVVVPVEEDREKDLMARVSRDKKFNVTDNSYPKLKRLTVTTTSDEEPIFYEINGKAGILAQPGDEAAQLAKKSKVPLKEFLKYNDLSDRDMIKTGNVYYLQKKGNKAPVEFHTAGLNQSFWDISQMYGVRLKKILKYNRLKTVKQLQAGQVVWIQRKRPKSKPVEFIDQPLQQEVNQSDISIASSEEESSETPLGETNLNNGQQTNMKAGVIIQENEEAFIEEEKKPVITKIESSAYEGKEVTVRSQSEINSTPTKANSLPKTHRVKQGETIFSLAKQYGLSIEELRSLNNMTSSSVLKYGQDLIISSDNTSPEIKNSTETGQAKSYNPSQPLIHTVSKGQTLYAISKMYGTSVSDIQRWNNITGNNIAIGQRLKVSEGSQNEIIASAYNYTVKKGDTLFSIAKRNDLSVEQLKLLNNLSSNTISVGQILKVR